MATLAAIRPLVFQHTNRPDLVVETDQAIRRALRDLHFSSFFWWDRVDSEEVLDPVDLLNYSINLPVRFRSFKFLYPNGEQERALTQVGVESIYDPHSYMNKSDVFYLGGSVFNVRFAKKTSSLFYGYYKLPELSDSWIADNDPETLGCRAAQYVWNDAEELAKANKLKLEADKMQNDLKQNFFDI